MLSDFLAKDLKIFYGFKIEKNAKCNFKWFMFLNANGNFSIIVFFFWISLSRLQLRRGSLVTRKNWPILGFAKWFRFFRFRGKLVRERSPADSLNRYGISFRPSGGAIVVHMKRSSTADVYCIRVITEFYRRLAEQPLVLAKSFSPILLGPRFR